MRVLLKVCQTCTLKVLETYSTVWHAAQSFAIQAWHSRSDWRPRARRDLQLLPQSCLSHKASAACNGGFSKNITAELSLP